MPRDRTADPRVTSTNGVTPGFETKSAAGPIEDNGQHASYWVLSSAEREKGFIRPLRNKYVHDTCGALTQMGNALSETYARQPDFYGSTFCVGCKNHFPVAEFMWDGSDDRVGA